MKLAYLISLKTEDTKLRVTEVTVRIRGAAFTVFSYRLFPLEQHVNGFSPCPEPAFLEPREAKPCRTETTAKTGSLFGKQNQP